LIDDDDWGCFGCFGGDGIPVSFDRG